MSNRSLGPDEKRKVQITIGDERVCMLGLGYVGLTLAVTLAELGVKVTGIDTNKTLIDTIQQGKSHFYERGLDALINKYIGKTFFVNTAIPENEKFNTFVISVGTPLGKNNEPNLDFIETSAKQVGAYLKPGNLVILRSTVPVGTTRKVAIPLLEKASGLKAGIDFSVVFAPERTVEGNALKELRELPQILGGFDEESVIRASNLFRKTTPTVVKVSSIESAEMIKIMDNSYRDLHFAISNEIALVSEKLKLNAVELIRAANTGYNRTNIPYPSPGVGGACLYKDPHIFLNVAKKVEHHSKFIGLGREINEYMPLHVADRVLKFISESKKGKHAKVFIMGFAFKARPLTSDTRNSPTSDMVQKLQEKLANLHGYDPAVEPAVIEAEFGVKASTIEDGFRDADCVIVMLNHDAYEDLDIYGLLDSTKKPCLFYDGWQQFKPSDMKNIPGILHEGVGFA